MASENDERRSDKKEHKHKQKHRERDTGHRDKDRDRERGRDRESGKDAERHAIERGSSHRSDRDRGQKRDRRDRHRDQGEDRKDKHVEQPSQPDKDSPRAARDFEDALRTSSRNAAEASAPSATEGLGPEFAAVKPQVQDSGGEVSMSIEETNRSDWHQYRQLQSSGCLYNAFCCIHSGKSASKIPVCRVRISLGLKPLSKENSADTKRKEFEARQKVQAEQERETQAAALAERVQKYVVALSDIQNRHAVKSRLSLPLTICNSNQHASRIVYPSAGIVLSYYCHLDWLSNQTCIFAQPLLQNIVLCWPLNSPFNTFLSCFASCIKCDLTLGICAAERGKSARWRSR